MPNSTFLAERSLYIENTLRHAFVYDLCRHLLLLDPPRMVTVLNAEVDDSGVDLILTVGGVTRPVQMKTLSRPKNGNPYNIAEALFSLPGACVIWTVYDPSTMKVTGYHYLGQGCHEPMGEASCFPQGRRMKGGVWYERVRYRQVKLKDATHLGLNIERLAEILFGDELRSGE